MNAALVFIAQMFYIFLLGIQSRNIRDGQMVGAAMVSIALGVCGLYMTAEIAKAATGGDGAISLAIAYVAAGPCGICLAIWAHDKWRKHER